MLATLSDLALVVMIVQINAFAVFVWRARQRDGAVMRALALREAGLTLFLNFFTVVYWDRRWDVIPGLDLHATLGFDWPWVPRLLVILTTARLLWVLRRTYPR